MNINTFLIALNLSMDATFVSISYGSFIRKFRPFHIMKMPISFGIFQSLMPFIGYSIGTKIRYIFIGYEHLIGAILLLVVGIKIIYEGINKKENNIKRYPNFMTILLLSIATSIDAFSIGITFALIKKPILLLIILSGIITVILSFIGIFLGLKIKKFIGKTAEIFSGIVIILIGIEIFFS